MRFVGAGVGPSPIPAKNMSARGGPALPGGMACVLRRR
jgi:hypothetical protein